MLNYRRMGAYAGSGGDIVGTTHSKVFQNTGWQESISANRKNTYCCIANALHVCTGPVLGCQARREAHGVPGPHLIALLINCYRVLNYHRWRVLWGGLLLDRSPSGAAICCCAARLACWPPSSSAVHSVGMGNAVGMGRAVHRGAGRGALEAVGLRCAGLEHGVDGGNRGIS